MNIIKMLDDLSAILSASDCLRLDYEEKREKILETVKNELDELDAEYQPAMAAVNENATEKTSEIKTAILEHGESVKGTYLQAVYVKGRVSWDTKSLEGYSAAHPEILAFKKSGEPSVSIRNIK